MGVRAKLFVVSISLVALAVLSSGAYLERELRALIERQAENELLRHALMAQESLDALPPGAGPEQIASLVSRLKRVSGVRFTVLARDGRALADSNTPLSQIDRLPNFGSQPDVAEALGKGHGLSRPPGRPEDQQVMYVAVAGHAPAPVIRVGMPVLLMEQAVSQLRWLLMLAALIGLVLAVLLSGLAAHLATRALQTLVEQTRAVATGASKHVEVASRDELAALGQSVNWLARELRAAVAALVNERDRLGTILQGMNEGVLALNGRLEIESANQAAVDILGLPTSYAGMRLVEAVRIPALLDLAAKARSRDCTADFSISGRKRREVLGHGRPLKASGGTVVVLHDVTETRRIESIRRDLVANVSHELRTPVSIIRANSETLLAGALANTAQAQKFVQAIERNSVRLSSLIADLLDLSRIEAERYLLEPKVLHPYELMEDLFVGFATQATARSISVRNLFNPALEVYGDRQAFEQVLLNLVDNAIKYSFEGGTVLVQGVTDGDQVRIEVRDDGPGIDEHHRERIFERFYRVDPGRSRELGGTGLGLSIVKHLVALSGGKIGVIPNEPRGSCFWFTMQTPSSIRDRTVPTGTPEGWTPESTH